MNLHSIVSPIVAAVNPNVEVVLMQSAGFTTNPDFSRSPAYNQFSMLAQIQGLQSDDIRILNGLGIQGVRRKIYLWGTWTGLVRSLQKGNDLIIFPDNSIWKVSYVFEDFLHGLGGATGWCSVAAVLQNPTSEDFSVPPPVPPSPFPPSPPPFINIDDPTTFGSLLSQTGVHTYALAGGSRVGQTLTITDVSGAAGTTGSTVLGDFNIGGAITFTEAYQSFGLYWSGTEWVVTTLGAAGGGGTQATVSLTANFAIPASASGTRYDNGGATGPVTATLPVPQPGLVLGFAVVASHLLRVAVPAGVGISLGTATSTTGLNSNLPFSSLVVYAPEGMPNQWVATSETGGWNVE